jgi:hypothetical protein
MIENGQANIGPRVRPKIEKCFISVRREKGEDAVDGMACVYQRSANGQAKTNLFDAKRTG